MKALQQAAFAVALLALSSGVIQANAINGTLGFSDTGAPTANNTDINASTMFTLGHLQSTGSASGAFVGIPTQDIGSISFDSATPTSFTLSSPAFGTFTSTSITKIVNIPGSVTFYILGTYSSGTFAPGATADSASFTLGFTQTPSHTGSISDSGTFADPPAVPPTGTPEPATLCLFGSAFIGLGFIRRRRKA